MDRTGLDQVAQLAVLVEALIDMLSVLQVEIDGAMVPLLGPNPHELVKAFLHNNADTTAFYGLKRDGRLARYTERMKVNGV